MSLHINVSELLHTSNTNCCNVIWPVHVQLWPELLRELQLQSRKALRNGTQWMCLENADGKLHRLGAILYLSLLSMALHFPVPPATPTGGTGGSTIFLPGCHHGAPVSQAGMVISFSSMRAALQVAAPRLGGAPATLCNWFHNNPSTS